MSPKNQSSDLAYMQSNNSNSSISDSDVQKEPNKRSCTAWTGYLFALLASLSAPLGALFIKLTNGDRMQIVFLRCVIQYMGLLPVISYKKINFSGRTWKETAFLLLNGFFSLLSMAAFTLSFNYLSLGDAMAIFFSFPALVGFFACLCLKEKCSLLSVVVTVVTLAGVFLIAQPSFVFGGNESNNEDPNSRTYGIFVGLIASTSVALTCVIVRQLGPGVHFSQSIFYFSSEGILAMIVYFIASNKVFLPCLQDIPAMFAAGLALFLCQVFVTLALQQERAGPVSLVLTSQVIFSFLLQFLAFGQPPTILGGIGSGLILLCSIVLAVSTIYNPP